MNVTVNGATYHVETEQELRLLLAALTTLQALARRRAA
jgi:hypothetical protein